MITSNREAMVVDASLPVEVYSEVLHQQHLTLKYVADTHIHADHLSRSKQLAETCNAICCLPANNKVDFSYHAVDDNAVLKVGHVSINAIHTPGILQKAPAILSMIKCCLQAIHFYKRSRKARPESKQ